MAGSGVVHGVSFGADSSSNSDSEALLLKRHQLLEDFAWCCVQQKIFTWTSPKHSPRGDDLRMPDTSQNTPLLCAIRNGDLKTVQYLAEHGADISEACVGFSALALAAIYGHVDIVRLLLKYGANVRSPNLPVMEKTPIHDQAQRTRWTPPLIAACYIRNKEIIQLILDAGASVNVEDGMGCTPLHYACDKTLIKQLVQKGAKLDKVNNIGLTPLMYNIFGKRFSLVALFLELGASLQGNGMIDPLTLLVRRRVYFKEKEYQCIVSLLQAGAAKECRAHCDTVLAKMIMNNKRYIIKMCLERECLPVNICKKCLKFCLNEHVSSCIKGESITLFGIAVLLQNFDVADYLSRNWFFTGEDLGYSHLRETLQRLALHESLDYLNSFSSRPLSLVQLSFTVISDAMGPYPGRSRRVQGTGLPTSFQEKLLFKGDSGYLTENDNYNNNHASYATNLLLQPGDHIFDPHFSLAHYQFDV